LSRIVNGGKSERHIIRPYQFKELDKKTKEPEIEPEQPKEVPKTSTTSNSNIDEGVVERLLEKIEELSNNMVKAQIEFENEIKKCYKECEEEKSKIYEEAFVKAKEEAKKECEKELQETKKLYEESIIKLQEVNKKFEEKLNTLEKELSLVAIDIAKEIIQKELTENSNEIAYSLAKALIKELKGASKVAIKANPKNAKYLKEKFKNLKVVADSAIKEGGVVILSDVGSIDGDIEERFNRVKETLEGS